MIYFLTFYTEGPEIDGCFDLSESANQIKNQLSKYFEEMFFFTKRTLKELPNSEDFCNEYEEVTEFKNSNKLGYFDFKPFLIDYILSIIPENSILLYHDSNFDKYPSYWRTDWENIESVCNTILNDNGSDFWVKYELGGCYVKNFVKTYTIDYFFPVESPENNIVKNSHLLNASQIILKNTQTTKDLINEWLEYSKNKDLLKPTPNPNPHPEAKMNGCVDQDILNCLIYRRILQKKINKNFPIYGFNWRSIRMDNYYSLRNEELISYLDNSKNLK